MTAEPTFVIVGASLAGGRAAETLRGDGFGGRLVLVGDEPERPYERPPLSKEYLRREAPRDEVFLRADGYYAEQAIELRLGTRVERLDVAERRAELAGGERLAYDKVLIVTGAAPRRLTVPGGDLDGIHYLRTLRDADRLGEALAARPRVLVVGAGFIGCEVAASARSLGCDVVMLDHAVPMARALGERLGRLYADVHRAHGVDVRIGDGLARFLGAGRLQAAVTSSGTTVPCDLAVVGIGVTPALALLAGQPIDVANGLVTDELCRTSVPDVFAAGDVANWWHPVWRERLRVEHFDHAQAHGAAAARSMLGRGEPYAPVPFFWSDQYDWRLQYVGHAEGSDELVLRGDPAQGAFSAFYVRGGRLRACAAVNRFKDAHAARRLLGAGAVVTAAQLADETVDLGRLAARAGGPAGAT